MNANLSRAEVWRSALSCAALIACERGTASPQTPSSVATEEVVSLPGPPVATEEPRALQLPCEDASVHAAIVDLLFADERWPLYVCNSKCSKAKFATYLETTQEELRDDPQRIGCFVRPSNAALEALIAVVLLDGMKPASYFNYDGIHIGPNRQGQRTLGYLDLLGEERVDAETWVTHRFKWSGDKQGYYHAETRERSDEE